MPDAPIDSLCRTQAATPRAMQRVPALENQWLTTIDKVAKKVLGSHDRTGPALVTEIQQLSELYTRDRTAIRLSVNARAARLRFFVPRDLPKIEGPITALHGRGLLPTRDEWRVVDIGAGYGATTLGLARAAKRLGFAKSLHVRAIDDDFAALETFQALAKEAEADGLIVPIKLEVMEGNVGVPEPTTLARNAELVLAGFVMNELFPPRPDATPAQAEETRIELLERWIHRIAIGLPETAFFTLLEPALKQPTRMLQAVRDKLLSRHEILHPCVHEAPCPLLMRERDWCHADLPLSLPKGLIAVAKEAGLRHEGLSYATLTVRGGGRPEARIPRPLEATIVGGPIETKGKVEFHLCHDEGMTRLDWLERHGAPPEAMHRGSLVSVDRVVRGERLRQGRDVVATPI